MTRMRRAPGPIATVLFTTGLLLAPLGVRGESPRGTETGEAPGSRGATREHAGLHVTEEQQSEAGCIAGRMQREFRHGLLGTSAQELTVRGRVLYNPTLPACWQLDPCTADIALTRPEDWRPPLSAVNVVVRGTDRVVKTDRDGHYEISVPSPDATLMFLAIGHNRVPVPVEGRSEVDVKLTPTPLPVIERLLGLIMPRMVAGALPDIDRLAADAGVNRETARDILWLVIGDRRMAEHYPDEYVPDYRFDDRSRREGGAP